MGRDKALLPWEDGRCSITRSRGCDAVCSEVRILCGPTRRYEDRGRPLVLDGETRTPDRSAGSPPRSPMPRRRPALFLGVDLPCVPVALLGALAAAADEDAEIVVPVTGDGPEPLCALYRTGCLPAVRARARRRGAPHDRVLARRARGDDRGCRARNPGRPAA